MRISACYIVKNEENNISRSIKSIQGEYDELVVVDTGSQDNTVAIATELGANCLYYEWKDDFSAARNYAISQITGDWVIFLDADQYYAGEVSIRKYISALVEEYPNVDAIYGAEINAVKPELPPSYVIRIFRHSRDVYYRGKIHEILIKNNGQLNIVQTDVIKYIHTGYNNEIMPHKLSRNLSIMLKDIAENGEKDKYYYYIAECYFGQRRYAEALEYIKKAIASPLIHIGDEANYYHILIESMRQVNCPLKKIECAAQRAIELFPKMPEFYGEKGMILSSEGRWLEALEALNKCVQLYKSADRMRQPFGYLDDNGIKIITNRISVVKKILKKVIIVIPIYKKLTDCEKISIKQMNQVLAGYHRTFIAPESLEIELDKYGDGVDVKRFPDYYFNSISSYSKLMLSVDFYKQFSDYEYMFIHQTDVFVFFDKLLDFCEMNYDYIGAPVERFAPLWQSVGARVGNGGASLRKISTFVRILEEYDHMKRHHPFAGLFSMWEDSFWGYCGQSADINFTVPTIDCALLFAVQGNVKHVYQRIQKGWRPFACHGWNRQDLNFWKPIIQAYGYDFENERTNENILHYCECIKNYKSAHDYINIRLLWGMCKRNQWNDFYQYIERCLNMYPMGTSIWKYTLEEFMYMCRRIEATITDKKTKIKIQRSIFIAITRAIQAGVIYQYLWNLLVKMVPLIKQYDYKEAQTLIGKIASGYWRLWKSEGSNSTQNSIKKKFIVAKTVVIDEIDTLRDFIQHTLTFADAVLIDADLATVRMMNFLTDSYKNDPRIIIEENGINDTDIFEIADLCIELNPVDFLMMKDKTGEMRSIIEKMDKNYDCYIDVKYFAPYLPYIHQNEFLLDRPLVVDAITNQKHFIVKSLSDNESNAVYSSDIYIARFGQVDMMDLENGIIPARLIVHNT